jgi:hypothetical protein
MNLCRKTALLFEIVPVLTERAMAISVREKLLSESATALLPRHVVRESTAMALPPISGRHHRKRKSFRDIAMAISRIRIAFPMGHDVITSPGHWLKKTSKDLFSLSRGLSEEGKQSGVLPWRYRRTKFGYRGSRGIITSSDIA